MDAGVDPTLDGADEAADDPDVRKSPPGDTMEKAEQAQSPQAPDSNARPK
jgi:hypothetical protein